MDSAVAASRHFVQGSACESAAWQPGIHLRQTEREASGRALLTGFDQPDLGAQSIDGGQRLHAWAFQDKNWKKYVRLMFSSC